MVMEWNKILLVQCDSREYFLEDTITLGFNLQYLTNSSYIANIDKGISHEQRHDYPISVEVRDLRMGLPTLVNMKGLISSEVGRLWEY